MDGDSHTGDARTRTHVKAIMYVFSIFCQEIGKADKNRQQTTEKLSRDNLKLAQKGDFTTPKNVKKWER